MEIPGWLVRSVFLTTDARAGKSTLYPFHVLGCHEDTNKEFSWSLSTDAIFNPRYDLSGAEWGEGTRQVYDAAVTRKEQPEQ